MNTHAEIDEACGTLSPRDSQTPEKDSGKLLYGTLTRMRNVLPKIWLNLNADNHGKYCVVLRQSHKHVCMQDLETRLLELRRQGQQDSVDLTRLQKGVQMRNNQVLFHKSLARTHTHLHRCVCCSLCYAWQDCMSSVRACARYI